MTAGLDGERRIFPFRVQPFALVDDIFIAALEAVVYAAVRADELGQSVARHGIGDNVCARPFAEQNRRNEGDETVAVDLFSVRRDGARTVYVRVEDDPEISVVAADRLADGAHRLFVFGIGNMVGKISVRVEKLRTRRVRAERFQHEIGVKPARTVSCVDDDPFSGERLLFPAGGTDFFYQIGCIFFDITVRRDGSLPLRECSLRREFEHFRHVRAFETALLQKELQTVLLIGEVACRDHDRSVRQSLFLQQHEHGGRGGESGQQDVSAARGNPFRRKGDDTVCREAGIVSDRDRRRRNARFLCRPYAERLCNAKNRLIRERDGVVLHAGEGGAPHIRSVSEPDKILLCHNPPFFRAFV